MNAYTPVYTVYVAKDDVAAKFNSKELNDNNNGF
jgi:hypothetical protein